MKIINIFGDFLKSLLFFYPQSQKPFKARSRNLINLGKKPVKRPDGNGKIKTQKRPRFPT